MKTKKTSRYSKLIVAAVILLLVACIGGIAAKYVRDYDDIGTLTLSAELKETVELQEHKAVWQQDGSYTLKNDEEDAAQHEHTTGNDYTVLPGVDIPKDPQLYLEDKTAIPVYLYVEMAESHMPATVTYDVEDCWMPLLDGDSNQVTGRNGGLVYVYTTDGSNPAVVDDAIGEDVTIPIIKENLLKVSDTADMTGTNFSLHVFAYMAQITAVEGADQTALDVFAASFQ